MAKRVPAALHHELSEYASLLRALRVRDTLDVTKHITLPNPFSVNTAQHDDELNSGDDVDDADIIPVPVYRHPSTIASGSNSFSVSAVPELPRSAKALGKEKATDEPHRKKKKRDHWTRWPLLLHDVPVPEWSLEDEVAVIVAQHLKSRIPPEFPIPPVEGDVAKNEEPMYTVPELEYDEEDPDPPFYVSYITATIANYLTVILAALAAHIPARTAVNQNRIEPLGWRTVLDVLVACAPSEFINPKVVENVIKRMEAIYGPSIIALEGNKSTSFRAVDRINMKKAAWDKLTAKMDEEDAGYWKSFDAAKSKSDPVPVLEGGNKKKRRKLSVTHKQKISRRRYLQKREVEKAPPSDLTQPEHQAAVTEANVASTSAIMEPARPETIEPQADSAENNYDTAAPATTDPTQDGPAPRRRNKRVWETGDHPVPRRSKRVRVTEEYNPPTGSAENNGTPAPATTPLTGSADNNGAPAPATTPLTGSVDNNGAPAPATTDPTQDGPAPRRNKRVRETGDRPAPRRNKRVWETGDRPAPRGSKRVRVTEEYNPPTGSAENNGTPAPATTPLTGSADNNGAPAPATTDPVQGSPAHTVVQATEQHNFPAGSAENNDAPATASTDPTKGGPVLRRSTRVRVTREISYPSDEVFERSYEWWGRSSPKYKGTGK